MARFGKVAAIVFCAFVGTVFGQQQQFGGGQKVPGQQGARGTLQTPISQQPWFSDQGIRNQLRINEDQFNRLNKVYGEQWNRYNTGISGLNNLEPAQRTQKMQQMSQDFYRGVNDAAKEVLNAEQMSRYNQLYLQHQGWQAFDDPEIQRKLNLTDEQRQKINQLQSDYQTQWGNLNKEFGTDREGAARRYNELRQKNREQMNSLLNEQQRQTWREMTGDPFDFPHTFGPQGQSGTNQNNQNQNNQNRNQTNNPDRN